MMINYVFNAIVVTKENKKKSFVLMFVAKGLKIEILFSLNLGLCLSSNRIDASEFFFVEINLMVTSRKSI